MFGINRSSWTQPALAEEYHRIHGEQIGNSTVSDLIRKSGYNIKKARRVLMSNDPDYKEKVRRVLDTLHSLGPDEAFFFVDEFGPRRVKKYGGTTYEQKGEASYVPKSQTHKGSVTLSAALDATTNQVS